MKILFVAAILVVTFVSAFSLYFLFNTKPTAATMTLTGTEIAERSANFLDLMRTNDGKYYFLQECVDNSTEIGCYIYDFSTQNTNAWPLLAYTSLYKSTADSSYLERARNDMQILSDYCSANSEDCLWILVQMIQYQKATGDMQYSSLISNLGQQLLTVSEKNSTMLLGIEARELALLYGMNGNGTYLHEATARMHESKDLWTNTGADELQASLYLDNGFRFYGYSCWTELAEIEIYQATNDGNYLTSAKSFFDSANIDMHSRKIDQLIALQPCEESLLKLYSITGNQKYWNQAANISQYIVTYRWDPNIQIAQKYNGDYGFLSRIYLDHNWKIITDTSYMIYLLTQMKDTQFQILEWN
jgi:hypothetical protein